MTSSDYREYLRSAKPDSPDQPTRNAFVALAQLASREQWCWDVGCTTCGHGDFRFAFAAIADGEHPDSPSWTIFKGRRKQRGATADSALEYPWTLNLTQQGRLSGCVAEARISDVGDVAVFPDWLGYYGLVLKHCYDDEVKSRRLTASFPAQLIELGVEHRRPMYTVEALVRRVATRSRCLTWEDLETIEADVIVLPGLRHRQDPYGIE